MGWTLLGRKLGMTRVYTDDGVSVPVTVIRVGPNVVTQLKTTDRDGYEGVQIGFEDVKARNSTMPMIGHDAKAKTAPKREHLEFRVEDSSEYELGQELGIDMLEQLAYVDVAGTSKGKGFQGAVKRWNFRTQDATHGNSLSHRAPGSIGQCQTPGRVFKGKKMAGQMGNASTTVQGLEIVRVDAERNLLLIKGSVPGAPGGDVVVRPATKG